MAYQMTKLVNAFTNDDGQRRFTWNPALAGHDEESGKGARYVYGKNSLRRNRRRISIPARRSAAPPRI